MKSATIPLEVAITQTGNDDRLWLRLLHKLDRETLTAPATGYSARALLVATNRARYRERAFTYTIRPSAGDDRFPLFGYVVAQSHTTDIERAWGWHWFPTVEAAEAHVANEIQDAHAWMIRRDWRQRAKHRPYDAHNWR